MSAVELFTYADTQSVRVVRDAEGDPLFVLADLCRVLELSNTSMVAERIEVDALSTTEVIDSMGRAQHARVVSESGMYE
ncbi:gp54 protein [Mycobacteroides abscessus subsp. abscessus]|nr:gp54 protein [Mycobacteroides abscessus subsp. abscessus]